MTSVFRYPGGQIQHTNASGADIASDDVVALASGVGIAATAIPDTKTGTVLVEGVFVLPKATGTAWVAGDRLDYDVSAKTFTKGLVPEAGDITGCAYAAEDAAAGAATGLVALTPNSGTVN